MNDVGRAPIPSGARRQWFSKLDRRECNAPTAESEIAVR
jgi:hypothetical protein